MASTAPLQRATAGAPAAKATRPVRRGTASPQRGAALVATQRAPDSTILRKLTVSKPNDPLELEADRIADQVMRMPAPEPLRTAPSPVRDATLRRKCTSCEKEELHRKAERPEPRAVEPDLHSGIAAARASGGERLSPVVRSYMEPRFGRDFGQVRIHTNFQACRLAKAVHARAFTIGKDVFFGHQQFAPDTQDGGHLLAHELAHTLQTGHALRRAPISSEPVDEDGVSGGARVRQAALEILEGKLRDSATLLDRLSTFSMEELRALPFMVESLRNRTTPNLDPTIDAALDEVRNLIAGRTTRTEAFPECRVSAPKPPRDEFSTDPDLQRVRTHQLILRSGASSPAVLLIQQAILAYGCEASRRLLLPRYGVDGSYGPETVRAVREFQRLAGIGIDGSVGPETLAALDTYVGLIAPLPQAPAKGTPSGAYLLGSYLGGTISQLEFDKNIEQGLLNETSAALDFLDGIRGAIEDESRTGDGADAATIARLEHAWTLIGLLDARAREKQANWELREISKRWPAVAQQLRAGHAGKLPSARDWILLKPLVIAHFGGASYEAALTNAEAYYSGFRDLQIWGKVVRGHATMIAALIKAKDKLPAMKADIQSGGLRTIRGASDKLSMHALGRAVDINPSTNPLYPKRDLENLRIAARIILGHELPEGAVLLASKQQDPAATEAAFANLVESATRIETTLNDPQQFSILLQSYLEQNNLPAVAASQLILLSRYQADLSTIGKHLPEAKLEVLKDIRALLRQRGLSILNLSPNLLTVLVGAGFRYLGVQLHPDRFGDLRDMHHFDLP